MKKTITLLLTFILALTMLVGCSKDEKNDKYVISNDNVDVSKYKGLEAKKETVTVTESEVNTYIEYVMNFTYQTEENQKEYNISELTDEMVKEISGNDYDNVADYKKYIESVIAQKSEEYNVETIKTTLFQEVVNNSELKKYDEKELQTYIDYLTEYYTVYAEYLGLDIETFYKDVLKLSSKTEYENYIKEESLNNLKTEYIIQAIAAAEEINITDEAIDEKIKEYIANNTFETEEEVLKNITREEIKTNLQYEQVLNVIYNNAKFTNATNKTK